MSFNYILIAGSWKIRNANASYKAPRVPQYVNKNASDNLKGVLIAFKKGIAAIIEINLATWMIK